MSRLGFGICWCLFSGHAGDAAQGRVVRITDVFPRVSCILIAAGLFVHGARGPDVAHGQTVKAFPTAEGFGANTVGGRGGQVIAVTNLADSGAGSLRDALQGQTGPRIVIFKVSGTITLTSGPIYIQEQNSYVTIAGQTSPGGIQVKGDGIFVTHAGHDVIMRHMRLRPGTKLPVLADTNAFMAWADDDRRIYNIIVDHCDFQWSTDQNGPDAFHFVENMTAQWSITAEGTNEGHTGGNHNTGMLIGSPGGDITYSLHHNLLANLGGRAPLVGKVAIVDMRNNIVYNWGGNGVMAWGNYSSGDWIPPEEDSGSSAFGNFVNNWYIAGPSQQLPQLSISNGGPIRLHGNAADRGGTKIYTSGNWGPYCPSGCADDWDNFFYNLDYYSGGFPDPVPGQTPQGSQAQFRTGTPYSVPAVTTDATGTLQTKILPTVGASKPFRDEVDARIVANVQNGTGDPNGVGAGGPWPVLTGGAPPTDTDGDGIPDSWESGHGLNPANASDGSAIASNGYTNVENYLNELAGDVISLDVVALTPAAPSNLRVVTTVP